jgi:hypothetical protein
MAEAPRRLRTLVYSLMDVEGALRTGGRADAARDVDLVVKRVGTLSPMDFLDEGRLALEAILLGERDLPVEMIGLILDVLAGIDDVFREVSSSF